ncbi:O-antigen translocase [Halpernia frigidisoli]|uniref:Membrane protein involved in the export of O-antigen and teichoic acid n=1 Tax=Halpernia frigidisoli TaxID=1125876 RepID=A0A1I3FD97_9FLAO|nr:O-antigen translocase [Halpernia frigidisoli]SFI09185.1 Membrane protein involved in the export of O-antigen and teichoic acid [Halpernia frigidisoli]
MSQENSSYKQIFKATSIFGGVQVFNILISILRAKFIAVIVGPIGIGLYGLLTSTIGLITSVTSFGLGASSIKDIAYANEQADQGKLLEISGVLNKLVWYTGGLGMILTLILSPLLSKLTFDNYDYTWSFVLLSVTLFLGQLTLGKDAVLQGTRQLKWLAYANMASSVISLVVTFPLYFIYGIKGIVPAMIVMSAMTLIVTQFFYARLKFVLPNLNFKETWAKGQGMLKLGFFLSLSGIIATACSYGVRIFITRFGGLEQVGFYTAGFGIINSYVGIVFTAMATDYFPRLSASIYDKSKFSLIVNQQGNVALIILGPILTAFVVFVNFAIIILYSRAFLPTESMMQLAMVGMFFKAAAWLLGFIVIAKNDTKVFFWSELVANIYHSAFSCVGFYFWGLEGLGYSFGLGYALHLVQMYFIAKLKYDFKFNREFLKIFAVQFIIALAALIVMKTISNDLISYGTGLLLIMATTVFSAYNLNRIINIKDQVNKILKKNK